MKASSERSNMALLLELKRDHSDLLAVGASCLALVIVTALPPMAEPLRVVVALLVVLFAPGYALLAALLPRPIDLEPLERLALSCGLSIFILTAIAITLNATYIGIRTFPLIVSVAIFSLACAAVAYYLRRSLPAEEQLGAQIVTWIAKPRRLGPLGWQAVIGLVLLTAVAVIGIGYTTLITRPFASDHLTQFYLLDQYGSPEALPLTVADGAEVEVILGIGNREGRPLKYRVELWIRGEFQMAMDDLQVADAEVAEFPVRFVPLNVDGLQQIEFRLFRQGDTAPYRDVYLWVE